MKIVAISALAAFIAAVPGVAGALETTQTVTVKAAPAATWGVIKDFDGIATWLPPAASSPADKGNTVGSVRTITLKAAGNPTVVEKLTAYAPGKRSYSYDIVQVDPKVLPVVDYHSTITVSAAHGGGAKVVWHGTFKPAAGVSGSAAIKAVNGVYRAGLDNIKAVVASK
jgi:hypothetical protein